MYRTAHRRLWYARPLSLSLSGMLGHPPHYTEHVLSHACQTPHLRTQTAFNWDTALHECLYQQVGLNSECGCDFRSCAGAVDATQLFLEEACLREIEEIRVQRARSRVDVPGPKHRKFKL